MQSIGTSLGEMAKEFAKKHNVDIETELTEERIAERAERNKQREIEFTKSFLKQKRLGIFNSSLVSDPDDLKLTFDDFRTDTADQQREVKQARQIANRIYKGEKESFLFSGEAGRGKTMLAVSILNGLNQLDTSLTCYFVSVEMFISLRKELISSRDDYLERKAYKVEQCIKNCDVLVLDDLGGESNFKTDNNVMDASNFVQENLFRIAEYRKNKTNIITTNNTGKELQRLYHQRVVSRLMTKKPENVIQFGGEDMRGR